MSEKKKEKKKELDGRISLILVRIAQYHLSARLLAMGCVVVGTYPH